MRDAGNATASQDANALSGTEDFVSGLGDGHESAAIQLDGYFKTFGACYAFFYRTTRQATCYCTDHRPNGAAFAASMTTDAILPLAIADPTTYPYAWLDITSCRSYAYLITYHPQSLFGLTNQRKT